MTFDTEKLEWLRYPMMKNYSSVLFRFSVIWHWIISLPWNLG